LCFPYCVSDGWRIHRCDDYPCVLFSFGFPWLSRVVPLSLQPSSTQPLLCWRTLNPFKQIQKLTWTYCTQYSRHTRYICVTWPVWKKSNQWHCRNVELALLTLITPSRRGCLIIYIYATVINFDSTWAEFHINIIKCTNIE
jgi:hypothetical protein